MPKYKFNVFLSFLLIKIFLNILQLTIYPREHNISMVIPADDSKRQNRQSAHEHGRLTEILPGDPAFRGIMEHQRAEHDAAHGPCQSEINLQEDRRISESLDFGLVGQVEERRIDAESADARRHEQNLDRLALQGAEVEEWDLVLDLVFVFDFAFLVFDVEDGASLWVVEGRRAVERAQDEGGGNRACDDLEAKTPTEGTEEILHK